MTVPGDDTLSNEEIVRFIDVLAAETLPGWVPSNYYTADSMVIAWRQAKEGYTILLDLMSTNKYMAAMIMEGQRLHAFYDNEDREQGFSAFIDEVTGEPISAPLSSFMNMRAEQLAEHCQDWDDPQTQLALFQLDSFLLGWLMAKQHG